MDPSTLLLPALGGALIGLAASILLLADGRVAGISGIVAGVVSGEHPEGWRFSFLAGLLGTGIVVAQLWPQLFLNVIPRSPVALVVTGLLVGVGTRLGNGCTAGHGVCGLSRGSSRSLVAVLVFIATGVVTATIVRTQLGGAV